MSEPHPLKFPIKTAAGATISSISIRRPKLKDLRAMMRAAAQHTDEELRELEGTMAILGCLTGLTEDELGELDPEDLSELGSKVADFLPAPASDQPKASARGGRSRRK